MNLDDHYETIFHPVIPNSVPNPSHLKRFEIKMFTFVLNDVVFQEQVILFLQRLDLCIWAASLTTSLPRFLYTVMLCFVMRVMESARDTVHLPCL